MIFIIILEEEVKPMNISDFANRFAMARGVGPRKPHNRPIV